MYQAGISCSITSGVVTDTSSALSSALTRGEVEQLRHWVPVGQSRARVSQLVEERVQQALHRLEALLRRVHEQARHQVDRVRRRARPEHLSNVN